MTTAQFEEVMSEYLRYMALKRQQPKASLVPSAAVDAVWHVHILCTKEYAAFCERNFGHFVHHDPLAGKVKDYLATLKAYAEAFGEDAPTVFWEPPPVGSHHSTVGVHAAVPAPSEHGSGSGAGSGNEYGSGGGAADPTPVKKRKAGGFDNEEEPPVPVVMTKPTSSRALPSAAAAAAASSSTPAAAGQGHGSSASSSSSSQSQSKALPASVQAKRLSAAEALQSFLNEQGAAQATWIAGGQGKPWMYTGARGTSDTNPWYFCCNCGRIHEFELPDRKGMFYVNGTLTTRDGFQVGINASHEREIVCPQCGDTATQDKIVDVDELETYYGCA